MSASAPQQTKFFLARIVPYNPRRGALIRSYTVGGQRFDSEAGWYRVDEATAKILRTCRQDAYDSASGPVFDVLTEAEAAKRDNDERAEKARAAGLHFNTRSAPGEPDKVRDPREEDAKRIPKLKAEPIGRVGSVLDAIDAGIEEANAVHASAATDDTDEAAPATESDGHLTPAALRETASPEDLAELDDDSETDMAPPVPAPTAPAAAAPVRSGGRGGAKGRRGR